MVLFVCGVNIELLGFGVYISFLIVFDCMLVEDIIGIVVVEVSVNVFCVVESVFMLIMLIAFVVIVLMIVVLSVVFVMLLIVAILLVVEVGKLVVLALLLLI